MRSLKIKKVDLEKAVEIVLIKFENSVNLSPSLNLNLDKSECSAVFFDMRIIIDLSKRKSYYRNSLRMNFCFIFNRFQQ